MLEKRGKGVGGGEEKGGGKEVWEREVTVEEMERSEREWAIAVEKAQCAGDRARKRR